MLSCVVGREDPCKQISLVFVGSACSVWVTLGLPPFTACVLSLSILLRLQAPGCFAGELSKAGPGLCALPRSKLLRFRFSGTPQRHRLSWACILCPSQVQAAQVTRCLASTLSSGGWCVILPPQSQLLSFLGAPQEHHLRCAVSFLGELISYCDPPGGCQPSRIPGSLG